MAFPRTLSARLLFYGGAVLSCMGAGKRERTDLSLGVEDLDVGTDMFETFGWILYMSVWAVLEFVNEIFSTFRSVTSWN